ncbi:glycosyl transferase group 1 (plasmid) [Solidesulfovibrio carbinoliphilus subsp. oakridgensis]|uniref:Glycosyl transferase group 1 n=1 Tax=Solidesulfovibrio carbinoliphilus subsp. oakridgensis TaxID=694327 RepID=G7QE72_9BACT|nr:glycosyltransferase family 4 protein [Solidesulfovibrio carbinoliphilus]EHJ45966.1 glycosyl transferase group 1 [Solidesulfovibrio carbinoliphilus subsp. oakridgensis]
MHILHVSDGYSTHDHRLLGQLSRRGRVSFLPLRATGRLERRPLPEGVGELALPHPPGPPENPAFTSAVAALRRLLAEHGVDAVQAGPLQGPGQLVAASGFHPFVLLSMGSDILTEAWRDARSQESAAATLRAADGLVCDCRAVAAAARRLADIPGDRTVVLPYGVEEAFLEPGRDAALRRELGFGDGSFLVLACRSFEPVYDVPTVVAAFGLAAARDPRLCLALAGDGSEAGAVRRAVERCGAGHRIVLPGRLSQAALRRFYRGSDCYLTGSRSDGSSVSLLEAMAAGLPVVASDIPGNREWVAAGRTGRLFPVGDPAAAARALLAVAAMDGRARTAMGEQGRRTVRRRAVWNDNVERLHTFYNALEDRLKRAGNREGGPQ